MSDKKPCDYCEYKNNPEICKSGYGCRQKAWDLMNEDEEDEEDEGGEDEQREINI